jgi:hypothetical protein
LAQIFPKWTNHLPTIGAVSAVTILAAVIGFFWYYGSPKYTDIGYRPIQPIDYSHKLHADDLGLDCRYCHSKIEESPYANVPSTQTCMNCHRLILTESGKTLPIRESAASGNPIMWTRVHNLPDYAYFDHSAHLRAGVGCRSCHGRVDHMAVVQQVEPLNMGWCLDCHRDPVNHLRPVSEITNMDWEPSEGQEVFAQQVIKELELNPPVDCSGCHR